MARQGFERFEAFLKTAWNDGRPDPFTAFNNLGFALMAMLFNWGRATLGTIPFVLIGAKLAGVPGAMTGLVCGATIFGLGAVATAYFLVGRLARDAKPSL